MISRMKQLFLILLIATTIPLNLFSQKIEKLKNRYYISTPNQKSKIIESVIGNIPSIKSVYLLKNSDIIIFEINNTKQLNKLRTILKKFKVTLEQDIILPLNNCTTPAFISTDTYNDMGYWNSLNQNILKEKQLMDSIFWLIKPQYWNNQTDSNETVKLVLSEIPNLAHQDMPSIDSANSFDYYRNSSISGTNATTHGSETGGVAFAKINNSLDMAGMSNVCKPILKNSGIDAATSSKAALISEIQSAIYETALNPSSRQVLSISTTITTSVDLEYDNLFNSTDTSQKVLLVIGAGNDGNPIGQTMTNFHPSVLTVQAGNGQGAKASFSSYNAAISFKGMGMRGFVNSGTTGTVSWQGTSASAPGTAGAIHLLWSLMPTKTAAEIRAILVDSLNTTTFITNPSNTKTPALKIGYLIQNLHFDIVHDYRDSTSVTSNSGIANLNNSVHDIQGGTIGNPTFWYQKNQTGSWIQIPNGILNKSDLGAGNHFLKLEFDIVHQPGKCTQIVRPIKLFSSPVYTFIGDGNWSLVSNWLNGIKPPATLTNNSEIIINPIPNGECILDIFQTISTNSKLTVLTGKKFRIIGDLKIQ
jgi:Subtilase family